MMDSFITHAPTIGLLFFFVLFTGIAVWAYKPSNKNTLQQLGAIPLKDENYDE
jgi:cbb3-type cytochrome oxidase subunit 3